MAHSRMRREAGNCEIQSQANKQAGRRRKKKAQPLAWGFGFEGSKAKGGAGGGDGKAGGMFQGKGTAKSATHPLQPANIGSWVRGVPASQQGPGNSGLGAVHWGKKVLALLSK